MRSVALVLLVVGLCLTAVHEGYSQASPQKRDHLERQECTGKAARLDVTAERMTFDQRTRTFLFEEKVHVRRCGMLIWCDRLEVINSDGAGKVERILATGNVRVQRGTQHVRAERAEYFAADERLVLTGNPRAWDTEKQHEVSGDEMVVFLPQDNIVVKHARALFHPQRAMSRQP
jgi:lipopolysaccharide transport protein LptA